jgi:hypothetical protein
MDKGGPLRRSEKGCAGFVFMPHGDEPGTGCGAKTEMGQPWREPPKERDISRVYNGCQKHKLDWKSKNLICMRDRESELSGKRNEW